MNKQVQTIIDGVQSSYHKIQTIDQELQGQLQIIRMLVVQLENKKLEVQLYYDKVLMSTNSKQNLQNILSKLSESQINQSILKRSGSEDTGEEIKENMLQGSESESAQRANLMSGSAIGTSNTKQSELGKDNQITESQRLRTLCDFVDEEAIQQITERADSSFKILKVQFYQPQNNKFQEVKDKALHVNDQLVKRIEYQISLIYKTKSDLDFQNQAISSKYGKLQGIIKELHQLLKSVERVHNQIDNINITPEQIYQLLQAIIAIHKQSENLRDESTQIMDAIKGASDNYDDFYESSRQSYVSFVNFAPSVQDTMQEVDKWFQQFEISRQQCVEDYEEIEKLSTWYEFFQKSYQELEVEIERRTQYEFNIKQKVNMFRLFLMQEIHQEQKKRMDFNDKHYRYLPGNLKQNLEDPPIRYEIYPKFNEAQEEEMIEIQDDEENQDYFDSNQQYSNNIADNMQSNNLVDFLMNQFQSNQNQQMDYQVQQNNQENQQDFLSGNPQNQASNRSLLINNQQLNFD
ncbi:UNKNOWN [Stylonychia lemnae]|uniref:Autophagy protein ATG17-like domain-containing protein n=1 Tax=Stylonychia lemnae TaxID=5949 RepID=A0A078ASY8_STYLE|nr:UNKNOWN [Stylonychia lemnae]|eukprot:CDW83948.1 UNKNOWN [Stylonychia lemnae]